MKIVSIATSKKKGTRKTTTESVLVKKEFGHSETLHGINDQFKAVGGATYIKPR